MSQCKTVI